MNSKSGWFGPLLRPVQGEEESLQLVVRYVWPFAHKNFQSSRDEYRPAVTVNGETVPAEWGTSIYVLREPSWTLRAVQGQELVDDGEIAGPIPVRSSGTVLASEPAELVYAPSGPGRGLFHRSNAIPPRLHTGRSDWRDVSSPLRTVGVWVIFYIMVLVAPATALLSKL
ncbi:hypothetical protein [Actinomadura sp. 3N508]|uniref:hypothetical protein n=1 Tax=Actinomadura sp. 3N508 TaxID=3375153 RepID=UPI00379DC7D1